VSTAVFLIREVDLYPAYIIYCIQEFVKGRGEVERQVASLQSGIVTCYILSVQQEKQISLFLA
jgi:hypothetical protein